MTHRIDFFPNYEFFCFLKWLTSLNFFWIRLTEFNFWMRLKELSPFFFLNMTHRIEPFIFKSVSNWTFFQRIELFIFWLDSKYWTSHSNYGSKNWTLSEYDSKNCTFQKKKKNDSKNFLKKKKLKELSSFFFQKKKMTQRTRIFLQLLSELRIFGIWLIFFKQKLTLRTEPFFVKCD